ncbi:hypothetical protein BpHYR1_022679 [Brachionus plicatilis]|uniref:Transmembrane protein n=1 Tax=Brachionus plicatilis TaxID=10195 RepID=A0A3M7SJD4_BRAPC|nr:hypothetical protein BpHYR1_022679 [Brachionus plicatilis]
MVSMVLVPYGINPNFEIVPRVMVTIEIPNGNKIILLFLLKKKLEINHFDLVLLVVGTFWSLEVVGYWLLVNVQSPTSFVVGVPKSTNDYKYQLPTTKQNFYFFI